MRRALSEKNLVIVLFIMVLVTFSLAQEDTKKIEKMYQNSNSGATSSLDETLQNVTGAGETAENLPAARTR